VSHVSERCFGAHSREQGIIFIIFSPRHGFFLGGALRPHLRNTAGEFEALSSACQIVNERQMKCVQLVQETKQGSCL
jgi:hypothetical protein